MCIDPKEGKVIWASKEVERTISTCSVADGLVYIADYTGRVHCFDAVGGTKYWEFDTKGHIWGPPSSPTARFISATRKASYLS
ncbi:MAG: PQQ-binding-like beta-propeller repeat protein [Verrucomicrobiales bacterium]